MHVPLPWLCHNFARGPGRGSELAPGCPCTVHLLGQRKGVQTWSTLLPGLGHHAPTEGTHWGAPWAAAGGHSLCSLLLHTEDYPGHPSWGHGCSLEGGERSERGRVWTGRREQVKNQVLEAEAEVNMLLWWAALPDRTCPMPRISHLSLDSRKCWGVCLLGPENSRCCTGSLHGHCGMCCWPVISNFYFIIYMNLGSFLGEFHLSKHWANLPLFKS